MPTDTLVRSTIEDDVFDLELAVMTVPTGMSVHSGNNDRRAGEMNVTNGFPTDCCPSSGSLVTCARTCGGISGRPCAC